MPVLVKKTADSSGDVVTIDKPWFLIGRTRKCDYVLEHPAVSRLHCIVRIDGDTTYLADNQSRNGTYINDDRLMGERALTDGDVITICGVIFEYHAEAPATVDFVPGENTSAEAAHQ